MDVAEMLALDGRKCDACGRPFALFNGDAPVVFKSRTGREVGIAHQGKCCALVVDHLDATVELWGRD